MMGVLFISEPLRQLPGFPRQPHDAAVHFAGVAQTEVSSYIIF